MGTLAAVVVLAVLAALPSVAAVLISGRASAWSLVTAAHVLALAVVITPLTALVLGLPLRVDAKGAVVILPSAAALAALAWLRWQARSEIPVPGR